jgi:hypothetical protein
MKGYLCVSPTWPDRPDVPEIIGGQLTDDFIECDAMGDSTALNLQIDESHMLACRVQERKRPSDSLPCYFLTGTRQYGHFSGG